MLNGNVIEIEIDIDIDIDIGKKCKIYDFDIGK
jgi:hypothetical protein